MASSTWVAEGGDQARPRGAPGRAVELAGERGALRRALAAVAARLIGQRAWERLGFARLSDYARERLGLSARLLYDLARVNGALGDLPHLEAALVGGRLSWTKARLVARVATPENERFWMARAQAMRATRLAREVRAVDRGSLESDAPETDEDGFETWPKAGVEVRCAPRVQAKWWRLRQRAQHVAGERLTSATAFEQLVAEVASAVPVSTAHEPACRVDGVSWRACVGDGTGVADADAPADCGGPRCGGACAVDSRAASEPDLDRPLAGVARSHDPPAGTAASGRRGERDTDRGPPAWLREILVDLEQADAFGLDRRARELLAREAQLDVEAGRWLDHMAERRRYQDLGCRSLEEWAREHLGMAPRKARALLRLDRAGRLCPELTQAYAAGRLSWVQAQTLIPLLWLDEAGPWRAAWVARAERVSVRRLEEDAERSLALHETDSEGWTATGGLPECEYDREARDEHRAVPAGRQIGAKPRGTQETHRLFWIVPREVARLFRTLLCTVRRRIERQTGVLPSEGEALETMLDHALEAWGGEDPQVRREHRVFARDGWRCTVPGCSSRRNLHDHHIRFRSAGGSDEPANRTTLCAWHHLRGVHAGIVRCAGRAPGRLRFELGLRAGRPPLLRYLPGERLAQTG